MTDDCIPQLNEGFPQEWTVRQGAMAVYYAQHNYAKENDGHFTEDVFALVDYLTYPLDDEGVLLGECMGIPIIDLGYVQG